MIRKYADWHYGISIPVPFARPIKKIWDPARDKIICGQFRKHIFITWMVHRMPMVVACEVRLRIGSVYL